ncbi:MAG: serine/threonine-protein phosphatase, partial [Gemmatimonadetes bacterium]|nr:serine/threonine-protein phosphatase [Gemmatimonadota bacterium]
MLDFVRPALLWAGAAAAVVPLLLHMIALRPLERAALPTARFLAPDPRLAVRLRRRPTDLLLLALRAALLLLLGAAAAGPFWSPRPADPLELLLLDRGVSDWSAAVDSARAILLAPDGAARGELVVFDTTAARVRRGSITPALFDSLAGSGPRATAAPYAVALRSLRGIAADRLGPPSDIIARLDRALDSLDVGALATCVHARIEQSDEQEQAGLRLLRWTSAGHLPPAVVSADGQVRLLDEPGDLMLG